VKTNDGPCVFVGYTITYQYRPPRHEQAHRKERYG
jgi:hypothetical protein